MLNKLQFITNQTTSTRRLTQDGVDYLIAPVIAIRAGELNGEVVTLEEISAHFRQWNGTPFVVGHPNAGGANVSANDPEILAALQIGQLFNVEMDGDKLKGEIWINLAQAAKVARGPEVVDRLENGQLEVSTAYFRDRINGAARNIRNDHLAALLDEKGACSWADGCGAPRINAKDKIMPDKNEALPLLQRIARHLGINQDEPKEKNPMKELIEKLRAVEGMTLNAEELEGLGEKVLTQMAAMIVEAVTEPAGEPEPATNEADPPAEPNPDVPTTNAQPCAQNELLMELAEAVKKRGGVEAFLAEGDNMRQQTADTHAGLVTQLVANAQCVMTKEELTPLPLLTLQSLARSFVAADYSGQGAGTPPSTGYTEYVM